MKSRARVGLALIGAGPWGRNVIRTISESDDARLVAVASRNPETRDLVSEDCAVHADWRDAIEAQGVEGVIIATPPRTHSEIAVAALTSGRGVLIEKPLAMTEQEARAVLAASVVAKNRPAMVDHIHLHHPAFGRLRRELAHLGPIRSIRGEAGRTGPFRRDVSVLWDWGAHDVAMTLAVMGADPVATSASERRRSVPGGTGESVELWLGFGGGVQAHISVSNMLEAPIRRFKVECEGGWALYDSVGSHPLLVQRGCGQPQPIPVEDRKPLASAISAFCTALASQNATPDDLALGVRVVTVLAACEKAMVQLPSC